MKNFSYATMKSPFILGDLHDSSKSPFILGDLHDSSTEIYKSLTDVIDCYVGV